VSHLAGNPLAGDVTTILNANLAIKAGFNTASPAFFGIGELGGRHSNLATGSETTSATFSMTVDLNQLAVKENLAIGFYGGQSFGAGITNVTLTISANGSTLVNQSFGSAAAAVTYFTNHFVDLGSLAAPLYASNTLNLVATLTVTSNSAGSGFYGNMLIGDPPSHDGFVFPATDHVVPQGQDHWSTPFGELSWQDIFPDGDQGFSNPHSGDAQPADQAELSIASALDHLAGIIQDLSHLQFLL